jgi:hypothetical protein
MVRLSNQHACKRFEGLEEEMRQSADSNRVTRRGFGIKVRTQDERSGEYWVKKCDDPH